MLGEASRANITLGYLLHFALVQNAELSCNCEAELQGEANARLASLGEQSMPQQKLYFCLNRVSAKIIFLLKQSLATGVPPLGGSTSREPANPPKGIRGDASTSTATDAASWMPCITTCPPIGLNWPKEKRLRGQ